jgi:hypothetical protein
MENPMDFKNMGMMGYSISLAASVKRLMSESSQTERDMIFKEMKFFVAAIGLFDQRLRIFAM